MSRQLELCGLTTGVGGAQPQGLLVLKCYCTGLFPKVCVCVNNKEPSQPPHFLFSVGNGIPTGKLSPGTHGLAYGKFSGEYGVMHSRHIAVIPSILYPAEEHVCSRVSGSNIADTGGILHHTLPLIPRDKG